MAENIDIIDKTEFIFEHLFWGMIAYIWYKPIFRCIEGLSLKESKWVLIAFLLGACILGIFLDIIGDRENEFSVFLNIAIGYGTYSVFTYLPIRKKFIISTLTVAFVISTVCFIKIMLRRIKKRNRRRTRHIIVRRIKNSAIIAQTMFGIAFALIIMWSGIGGIFGNSILNARIRADNRAEANKDILTDNMEMIMLIGDCSWDELSVQDRLDVFQAVANIEKYRLGLSNELNVGSANLNKGTKGYYSDGTHEIILSIDSLLYDSPSEILNTVCHEAYHSWEHRMVDAISLVDENSMKLALLRDAAVYADEFANYIDGDDDFCGYYEQEVESDAREYAEEEVKYYYSLISDVLTNADGY